MAPTKDAPDPRSKMTDRAKFMVRSLHTPRIVSIVAVKLAAEHRIASPTDAVRRACRLLDIADDYDVDVDPTMAACVKLTRKAMGK